MKKSIQQSHTQSNVNVPKQHIQGASSILDNTTQCINLQHKASLTSNTIQCIQPSLAKDKLNVVGEDHEEEDEDRRKKEEKFTKNQIKNGSYWRENEFQYLSDTNPILRFLYHRKKYGDPPLLRILQLSLEPLTFVELWVTTYSNIINKTIDEMRKDFNITHQNTVGFQKNCQKDIIEINANYMRVSQEELANIKVTLNDQTTNFQNLIDAINNSPLNNTTISQPKLSKMPLIKQQIFNSLKDICDLSLEIYRALQSFSTAIKNQYSNYNFQNNEGIDDTTQVQKARSKEMHKAANSSYQTKGVWKIGYAHVNDIIDSKEKLNYNLILKDDFKSMVDANH